MGHTMFADQPAAFDAEVYIECISKMALEAYAYMPAGEAHSRSRRHTFRQDEPLSNIDVFRVCQPYVGPNSKPL